MNPLQQIQEDMFARLLAAPYFADIGVFLFRPRAKGGLTAVQSDVDNNLAGLVARGGKTGLAVIVLMPIGNALDPNVPGPRLQFVFQVRVIERPMVNMSPDKGTLKPAEEVVLEVLQMFHHCKFNRSFTLVAGTPAMVPTDEGGPERVIYDCRFEQLSGLAKPLKCVLPVITPADAAAPTTVAITTATPGAAIFYSLDDSYPSVQYDSDLTISLRTFIRAIARLDGYQDSDVADLMLDGPAAISAPVINGYNNQNVNGFTLYWDAATGGVGGVDHYEVVRDGITIATTSDLFFAMGDLVLDTEYIFVVKAFDHNGNFAASVPAALTNPTP